MNTHISHQCLISSLLATWRHQWQSQHKEIIKLPTSYMPVDRGRISSQACATAYKEWIHYYMARGCSCSLSSFHQSRDSLNKTDWKEGTSEISWRRIHTLASSWWWVSFSKFIVPLLLLHRPFRWSSFTASQGEKRRYLSVNFLSSLHFYLNEAHSRP